jgi:cytidyltransferase-like protein
MNCYVPFTGDIITSGHIKFFEEIRKKFKHPIITVGLLTDDALKGYKKTVMSYKDRFIIISALKCVDRVIPQKSLDPLSNLMKTGCMAIATGDGWEPIEEVAICKWIERHKGEQKKLGNEAMEEKLWKPLVLEIRGKNRKLPHSSDIKKKICQQRY